MGALPRYTLRTLQGFPTPLDDQRYEIIDGELYVSKQPHWAHQLVTGKLFVALASWSQRTGAGVPNIAPGVIFALDEAVAPDLVWVSRARLPQVLGEDGKLTGAPDLVVEVLSPGDANEQRDREAKLDVYSRRGVPEYWIVDWRSQRIEVHRRRDARLQLTVTLLAGDRLESPMLPGFNLPVADLFSDLGSDGNDHSGITGTSK